MAKPKTWEMQTYGDPEIEGTGSELTFVVKAYRKTKAGTRHDFVLRIHACRHGVKVLAEQIRAMQDRDLERIRRETDRITTEVQALKR